MQEKPENIDINTLYENMVNSIEEACRQYTPDHAPKMSCCSSRTVLLCKEKNSAWSTYIKTRLQTQKMAYHLLSKEVKISIKADKKFFQTQEKIKVEIHKTPSISVADNVALFFPTQNKRTILSTHSKLPKMMKAASDDQLQPISQAMKMHLSRIYAERNFYC